MTEIGEYLHGCRQAVVDGFEKPLHVVIGNEAADADSIVSAIALAYLYHTQCVSGGDDVAVVPVVCIPSEDIELRRDTAVLLQKAGVDIRNVMTLTDLESITDNFTSSAHIQAVTLVDHNKLTPKLHALFGDRVTEIYDHHEDAQEYTRMSEDMRHIAFQPACDGAPSKALVASTCSLIAEKYAQEAPHAISAEIALILIGVILLDSINLSPAAGKVTARDDAMVKELGRHVAVNQSELFEELNRTKSDPEFWQSLSVMNCLRLDCKQFPAGGKNIVMSAVLMPIQSFLSKESFDEDVDQWMERCGADVLVILTLATEPEVRRQLCCVAHQADALDGLAQYLAGEAASSLQLRVSERKQCPTHSLLTYEQDNARQSRKQVAPIILQYFEAH